MPIQEKKTRKREKYYPKSEWQRKKIGRRNKLSRHFHLPQTSTRHSLHTITLLKACPLEGRRAAQLARLIEFDPLRFIEWHRVETILAKSEISPHSSSLEERREERKSCSWSPRNDWNRDKTCPKSVFIWWIKSWWLDISNVYIYIYFCQRRLRLDLGPLCRWPIRARRRIGDEGRLKNCVCKRERERGRVERRTVWRVIDCAAWLQRVADCLLLFFPSFFPLFWLEIWGREREEASLRISLPFYQSSPTFLICRKILKEEGNNSFIDIVYKFLS